jgi:polyhydroxybutyrate depolymerase
MKMIRMIGAVLGAMVVLGWGGVRGAIAEPGLVTREWKIEGVARQGLLHVPAKAKTEAVPVVFVFHGHGGTMGQAARSFGVHTLWSEAIVVYLQGLPTVGALTDPEGKRPGWQKTAGDYGDRDLKFFDAVLATLQKENRVDARRIFSTGHSNGGGFTYLLWAERGPVFAAVAPSAAVPGAAWYQKLTPKPALHVAGTTDELVKYAWQDRTMTAVRKLNGCAAEGVAWAKSGPITGTLYPSKTGTPFVSLIYPGSHKFPAEAPALIVRFFKEQAAGR